MGEQRIERRLAAILAADGRLIGATEVGALRVLIRLPKEIVDPALTAHAGSIVKLTGDGIFIKFTSAVDAVAAPSKCNAPWSMAIASTSRRGLAARLRSPRRVDLHVAAEASRSSRPGASPTDGRRAMPALLSNEEYEPCLL